MPEPDARRAEHEPDGRARRAAHEPDALARTIRGIGAGLVRVPRTWAVIPVLAWAALIWGLSSLPPPIGGVPHPAGSVLSNFAHAPEYGVFALLLALVAPRRDGWPDLAPATIAKLLAVVLVYAVTDEIHQSFTVDRDASALDVLTDLVGAWLTLRVIASAAGPHATSERLGPTFAWGILACLACALLASYVPEIFPTLAWL